MIYLWPFVQLRRRLPFLGVRVIQFSALSARSAAVFDGTSLHVSRFSGVGLQVSGLTVI